MGKTMESKLSRLVKRIRESQPEEIDCSACLDHISAYVDLELEKGSAVEQLPLVKQHLDQCSVCYEEYQLLRELALMEKKGDTPTAKSLIDQLKNPPQ